MKKSPFKWLILGCGYLGTQISEIAVNKGDQVDALTRNQNTCSSLRNKGVHQAIQSELHNKAWHKQVDADSYDAVVVCVGSAQSDNEGYRRSYIDGLKNVIKWCINSPSTPLIYTSSISVYGGEKGQWIDEKTPLNPQNWRGEFIQESEKILLNSPLKNAYICRLGGIYGPNRDHFLIHAKTEIKSEKDDYYLNLIHVLDASQAIYQLAKNKPQQQIYNLTDNQPILRSELNKMSKTVFGKKETFGQMPARRRNPGNRRIQSKSIQKELQWSPQFQSAIDYIHKQIEQ